MCVVAISFLTEILKEKISSEKKQKKTRPKRFQKGESGGEGIQKVATRKPSEVSDKKFGKVSAANQHKKTLFLLNPPKK